MRYPHLESRGDILKMLDEITQARKTHLQDCANLTQAQLTDPVWPGTWPVLKILGHLASAEAWMLRWMRERPAQIPLEERPADPPLELPAVALALDEAHAAVIAFVKAHGEEVLREQCYYARHGEQTVGGVLYHVIEHELHHRAFLKAKLRLLKQG